VTAVQEKLEAMARRAREAADAARPVDPLGAVELDQAALAFDAACAAASAGRTKWLSYLTRSRSARRQAHGT
jgi:hypothetical protein